jgi:DNA-nicking Smr family endonuclease
MKSRDPQDDVELFDQAVADVKRLHHNLAAPKKARTARAPAPSPDTVSTEAPAEFGEELRYVRPGIQISVLHKLRRGQFPIEATLDLHGLHAAQATERLQRFLGQRPGKPLPGELLIAGRWAVRIVHGKGYGSAGRPVLKTAVRQLLLEFPSVLAFCSAGRAEGGTGAVDVLLQKPKGR